MLKATIETEVKNFIEKLQSTGCDGKKKVVCNDSLPTREVKTKVGPIEVEIPLVRSRNQEPLSCTSSLLPKHRRKHGNCHLSILRNSNFRKSKVFRLLVAIQYFNKKLFTML